MKVGVAYQEVCNNKALQSRVEDATEILRSCQLCPRECNVNRLAGETGRCGTGRRAIVSSYGPHFGEESPLVGSHGSGTIFFARCNLECVFCQNYTISQFGEGQEVSTERLASIMLSLQLQGCHNINLVTPTHVVPQILEALVLASVEGLSIPLVYNCGGYESVETLKLLDGIVDIYMPDMKYSDAEVALQYSGIKCYPNRNREAVKEMHRQVGDMIEDTNGVATRGLLVRHLVLPSALAGTAEVVRFLSREISVNTYLNIMAQYRPCHKAYQISPLARSVTRGEYVEAVSLARNVGLQRLDVRHLPSVL